MFVSFEYIYWNKVILMVHGWKMKINIYALFIQSWISLIFTQGLQYGFQSYFGLLTICSDFCFWKSIQSKLSPNMDNSIYHQIWFRKCNKKNIDIYSLFPFSTWFDFCLNFAFILRLGRYSKYPTQVRSCLLIFLWVSFVSESYGRHRSRPSGHKRSAPSWQWRTEGEP